jgi:hypothetical protein
MEFNCVRLTSRRDIREQVFLLLKTVNGVAENSKFLEKFDFNMRKGNLCTRHLLCYHKNINIEKFVIT